MDKATKASMAWIIFSIAIFTSFLVWALNTPISYRVAKCHHAWSNPCPTLSKAEIEAYIKYLEMRIPQDPTKYTKFEIQMTIGYLKMLVENP